MTVALMTPGLVKVAINLESKKKLHNPAEELFLRYCYQINTTVIYNN